MVATAGILIGLSYFEVGIDWRVAIQSPNQPLIQWAGSVVCLCYASSSQAAEH